MEFPIYLDLMKYSTTAFPKHTIASGLTLLKNVVFKRKVYFMTSN